MKKTLVSIVFLCCLLFVSASLADTFLPMNTDTSTVLASLSISGDSANCVGTMNAIKGASSASVAISLQRKVNGSWETIHSKTVSSQGRYVKAEANYAIASGYAYRVKAVGKTYDSSGNLLETITRYSATYTH